MGIVRWHVQMSLDGYIAAPGDDMRWAFEAEAGPDETIDEVVASTGALLVGRRTMDVEDHNRPGFYGGAFRGPFFVLRHRPPPEPPVVKGVVGRYLTTDIEDAVATAREAAGGLDVGVLGATVAGQCLDAGLVDEILVHVTPVLLGDGVRFHHRPGGRRVRLRRTAVGESGQLTALRFTVVRDRPPPGDPAREVR